MLLSLSETQSITPSDGCSPQRTCSAIWEPGQKGMSIHRGDCVWVCVNGCVWGHVAYWDNQIHSDSKWAKQRVILLSQFSCQRVKRQGLQTKKALRDTGDGEKISSGKADLVCQTNLQHTWARKLKVIQPTHRGLGHLSQLFWFSLKSSTYARVDANCYLRLAKRGRRGMWNASNALTICRVVFATAAAAAPTAMCKVKLSVWRLVKMSGPTGQDRAPSQRLTNLHSSFYRAGAEPEIHATYPNTTTLAHTNTDQETAKAQGNRGWNILSMSGFDTGLPMEERPTGESSSQLQTDLHTERYWQNFPPRSVEKQRGLFIRRSPISSFSIESIWRKPAQRLCKVRRA